MKQPTTLGEVLPDFSNPVPTRNPISYAHEPSIEDLLRHSQLSLLESALDSTNPLLKSTAETFLKCLAVMEQKNHDYTQGTDPLGNFKANQKWGVTTLQSIACRMEDKVQRLATFVSGKKLRGAESCQDSCEDLINYAAILLFASKQKEEK